MRYQLLIVFIAMYFCNNSNGAKFGKFFGKLSDKIAKMDIIRGKKIKIDEINKSNFDESDDETDQDEIEAVNEKIKMAEKDDFAKTKKEVREQIERGKTLLANRKFYETEKEIREMIEEIKKKNQENLQLEKEIWEDIENGKKFLADAKSNKTEKEIWEIIDHMKKANPKLDEKLKDIEEPIGTSKAQMVKHCFRNKKNKSYKNIIFLKNIIYSSAPSIPLLRIDFFVYFLKD